MSEPHADARSTALLGDEIVKLVALLPGSVASITARAADCSLRVTWSTGEAVRPAAGAEPEEAPPPASAEHLLCAPMVGTFYAAAEPQGRPFVAVGDRVVPGQPIGIVEAMKLMNTIDADIAGTVTAILVSDTETVEFGQPLIRIHPDSAGR